MKNLPFIIEHVNFIHGEKEINVKTLYENGETVVKKTGIPIVWESSKTAYQLALECLKEEKTLEKIRKANIKAILYVTQSPDWLLPAHSCRLQEELNLPHSILALDINQGCTGFVQALSLGSKILEKNSSILIVTTDNYRSKVQEGDITTGALFSDAASVTLMTYDPEGYKIIAEGNFTEGKGADSVQQKMPTNKPSYLYMNGGEVYKHIQKSLLQHMENVLAKKEMTFQDVDTIFIHQGSKLVLENITNYLKENNIKTPKNLEKYGNTTSSTIPSLFYDGNKINPKELTLLTGFGVGFAATSILLGNAKNNKNKRST